MTSENQEPSSGQTAPPTQPLEDEALRQAIGQVPIGARLEEAFSAYLLACVSLGFARVAAPPLLRRAEEIGNHPLSAALRHLATSLAQKAVLDAAATYDQAGEGASSLANGLTLITRYLRSSTSGSAGDRRTAKDLVNDIRESVIVQKTPEMKAIQYWRNKWAGHQTVDPQVDPWAWEHAVDFDVIEAGLENMRAAFHEFALLLLQLPGLASLHAESLRIDDSTSRLGISLDGTTAWPIKLVLAIGEAQAREFLDRALPVLTLTEGRS